jgi:hypothetical protein
LKLGNETINLSTQHFNCESSNIIYSLKCKDHPQDFYIGETKTPLKRRFYQHRSVALKAERCHTGNGGIFSHFNVQHHEDTPESLIICPIEGLKNEDTIYRRFRETHWIERFQPPLNKDVTTIRLDMGI